MGDMEVGDESIEFVLCTKAKFCMNKLINKNDPEYPHCGVKIVQDFLLCSPLCKLTFEGFVFKLNEGYNGQFYNCLTSLKQTQKVDERLVTLQANI